MTSLTFSAYLVPPLECKLDSLGIRKTLYSMYKSDFKIRF